MSSDRGRICSVIVIAALGLLIALTVLPMRPALGQLAIGQDEVVGDELIFLDSQEFAPPDFGSVAEPHQFIPPGRAPRASQLPNDRLSLLTQSERAPFRFVTGVVPRRSLLDSTETLAAQSLAGQLALPLRIFPDGILLGTASLQYTQLSTDAQLPVSGTPIPDQLWDIRSGMFVSRTWNGDWKIGGLFNFGSASDRPFESGRELTMTSLGFLSIPARNRNRWNFSLFYSPTSQVAFPIPGIAYAWRPNDQFEAQIGLPASLTYAPNESFSFRARYTPVTDLLVEARQSLGYCWQLFGRYQIINDTYWLADRADHQDRFFQFEQQLVSGLACQLAGGFSLEMGAGYLFDRRFFQSSQFDLNSDDLIQVDPGVVYSAQIIWIR